MLYAAKQHLTDGARHPISQEEGQALAEYGLILAFIAVVCLAAVTALGLAIAGQLGSITGSF